MKRIFAAFLLFILLPTSALWAIEHPENDLEKVGISTKQGDLIDLGLVFTNSKGEKEPLSTIFAGTKPVILVPVYYGCPRLCGFLLSGVVELLNGLQLNLGSDYKIVTVSFDETEGPELAAERAKQYREQLKNRSNSVSDWHFLVGSKESITPLMKQIGFRYMKDGQEFAHSAVIIILTPGGKISQYFTGINFAPWDVKLSLVEASQGGIGSAIDHILLYCFRFDPTKGKYTWAAFNVMRAGGVLSLLALAAVIFLSARRSGRWPAIANGSDTNGPPIES